MMESAWTVVQRLWDGVAFAVDASLVVHSSSGISWLCCLGFYEVGTKAGVQNNKGNNTERMGAFTFSFFLIFILPF